MNISPTKFELIEKVVNTYFNFMDEIGGNSYINELIPEIMLDRNKTSVKGLSYWLPISSTVSEQELIELEMTLRHKLPESFRFFLCQRHFVELWLGQYQINFFSNLPQALVSKFKNIIEEQFPGLQERGYIPFANFGDYGVLCFDTNSTNSSNDYPIVLLGHEDEYDVPDEYASNFLEMFYEFETHLDQWIKNNREIRRNAK